MVLEPLERALEWLSRALALVESGKYTTARISFPSIPASFTRPPSPSSSGHPDPRRVPARSQRSLQQPTRRRACGDSGSAAGLRGAHSHRRCASARKPDKNRAAGAGASPQGSIHRIGDHAFHGPDCAWMQRWLMPTRREMVGVRRSPKPFRLARWKPRAYLMTYYMVVLSLSRGRQTLKIIRSYNLLCAFQRRVRNDDEPVPFRPAAQEAPRSPAGRGARAHDGRRSTASTGKAVVAPALGGGLWPRGVERLRRRPLAKLRIS